ncbi:MAG TPA: hypothetical protein VNA31_00705 [bacterium]|nr:hypothetical protein [bacterium]
MTVSASSVGGIPSTPGGHAEEAFQHLRAAKGNALGWIAGLGVAVAMAAVQFAGFR